MTDRGVDVAGLILTQRAVHADELEGLDDSTVDEHVRQPLIEKTQPAQ